MIYLKWFLKKLFCHTIFLEYNFSSLFSSYIIPINQKMGSYVHKVVNNVTENLISMYWSFQ